MLRVIYNRKPKYFGINIQCSPDQWEKSACRLNKHFKGHKERNRILHFLEEKALRIIDGFIKEDKPFTFNGFEKEFIHQSSSKLVFEFFEELMDRLNKTGKAGNHRAYKMTRNALKKFYSGIDLDFSDIDYVFLKKFESHLFQQGCTDGGVSFYMRTLRAAINEAIRCDYAAQESYPFSTQFNRNGYSISHLKSQAKPRPLSLIDMDKVKNFSFEKYPHLSKSVRYFLFSYYARGMNFIDMAKLKWSDIYNGRIEYLRAKTGKKLSIKISEPLEKILSCFKGGNDIYVFPVLTDFHKTAQQIKDRVRKCLKYYNKDLKQIASVLDIDIVLTSYVARHSYATTLKKKGIEIAVISEAMGHADVATTQAYLEKFSSDIVDNADLVL